MKYECFPIRGHHLAESLGLACALVRYDCQEVVIRPVMSQILFTDVYDLDFSSDELRFLQLVNWFAVWHRRSGYKWSDYVGRIPAEKGFHEDRIITSLMKIAIAPFVAEQYLQIGQLKDGACRSCAIGEHCTYHDQNDDDGQIARSVAKFSAAQGEQIQENCIDGLYSITVNSSVVRKFLFERTKIEYLVYMTQKAVDGDVPHIDSLYQNDLK